MPPTFHWTNERWLVPGAPAWGLATGGAGVLAAEEATGAEGSPFWVAGAGAAGC